MQKERTILDSRYTGSTFDVQNVSLRLHSRLVWPEKVAPSDYILSPNYVEYVQLIFLL